MFFISTMMGGQCLAPGTDVCKTPIPPAGPVPIPYPNFSLLNQVVPSTASRKVKILNHAVVLKPSKTTMSTGDEPGSAGGVVSGVIKGPAQFLTYSAKVKVEGKNVIYHTCQTTQNKKNTVGIVATPSQTKVTVAY